MVVKAAASDGIGYNVVVVVAAGGEGIGRSVVVVVVVAAGGDGIGRSVGGGGIGLNSNSEPFF